MEFRRRNLRGAALILAGAFTFLDGPAKANDATAYLEYAVDPGCPGRSTFVDQVRARSPRVRFADQPGNLWVFRIEAAIQNGRASGKWSSRRGKETGVPRTVDADGCADVVAALALMTALAIDTQAPQAEPPAEVPTSEHVPRATRAPTHPEPRAAVPVETPLRGTELTSPAMAIGAHGTGTAWPGSTPVFLPGGAALLEGTWPIDSLWAPAFRLSIGFAASPTVRPAVGDARFTLASGQLDACPMRWALGRETWVRPCVALQAGRLTGTGLPGAQISVTQSASGPWWAVAQFLRLHAGVGGGWAFELQAGIAEPIVRDAFAFRDPDVEAVRVPRVVPTLEAGVALQLR
jgi:hypothetical protein